MIIDFKMLHIKNIYHDLGTQREYILCRLYKKRERQDTIFFLRKGIMCVLILVPFDKHARHQLGGGEKRGFMKRYTTSIPMEE